MRQHAQSGGFPAGRRDWRHSLVADYSWVHPTELQKELAALVLLAIAPHQLLRIVGTPRSDRTSCQPGLEYPLLIQMLIARGAGQPDADGATPPPANSRG